MADVNSNPAQGNNGGPSIASTGPQDQVNRPDSQKGDAANPIGAYDHAEKARGAPDVEQSGGRQPSDPVQRADEEE
ncbi:hypothetical protein [Sphingomicrobium astaxanthinifaciens]|uniref:hypothetical protein n=1 Tax=Sphingomicrobium astaxanthinifaciens TaxID=1227949 RepID=UPI001FCC630E|nr:hypothetical protein [Sphingomicrobium astaxanthinifaciens]MCJ7420924.1 hypothetical protein [Sphingomicrobium astaxanthinifaciens]